VADPDPGRLAATFDLVAAALDAGLPPTRALATVAVVMPEGLKARTERVAAMLELSNDPLALWELLAADDVLGPLGTALARAEESGAPVAEAVRVLADESRRTDRTERLERARRVGVRTAAPLGLCFLPTFLLVAVVPTVIGLIGDVF
jgi:pilus assembly protein TadC